MKAAANAMAVELIKMEKASTSGGAAPLLSPAASALEHQGASADSGNSLEIKAAPSAGKRQPWDQTLAPLSQQHSVWRSAHGPSVAGMHRGESASQRQNRQSLGAVHASNIGQETGNPFISSHRKQTPAARAQLERLQGQLGSLRLPWEQLQLMGLDGSFTRRLLGQGGGAGRLNDNDEGAQAAGEEAAASAASTAPLADGMHPDRQRGLARLQKVLETYTDVCRYPLPRRPDAAVFVAAEDDAYVSMDSVLAMQSYWKGSGLQSVSGGHVSAFLMHQDAFRSAMMASLNRLKQPPAAAQPAASSSDASASAASLQAETAASG